MIGAMQADRANHIDETNFPHKLLLTDRQVSERHKAYANNSSGNIKIYKIINNLI